MNTIGQMLLKCTISENIFQQSMSFGLVLNDRTLYIYLYVITLTLLTAQLEKFLALYLKTSLSVLRTMSLLLKAMGKQSVMVTCA